MWFEFVESKIFHKQVRDLSNEVLINIQTDYLYLYLAHAGRIHLLYLFSKGEQGELSPEQKRIIAGLSQDIRKERL